MIVFAWALPWLLAGVVIATLSFAGLRHNYFEFSRYAARGNPGDTRAAMFSRYGRIWVVYFAAAVISTCLGATFVSAMSVGSSDGSIPQGRYFLPAIATVTVTGMVRFLSVAWKDGVTNSLVLWMSVGIGTVFVAPFLADDFPIVNTLHQLTGSRKELQLVTLTVTLGTAAVWGVVEFLVYVWEFLKRRELVNQL